MIPVMHPPRMNSMIVEGQKKPFYQGWFSGAFNDLIEAPVLVNTLDDVYGTEYIVYFLSPAGSSGPGNIRVRCTHNDPWTGEGDRPLRIKILESNYKVEISYMPSRSFILNDVGAPGEPVIKVRKRRR